MAKKPRAVTIPTRKLAAQEMVTSKEFQGVLEVSETALMQQKVDEIGKLLWMHQETPEATKHERLIRALELYESLEAGDGAEGMLALQMVGTHQAALECLKRAALPNQTLEGRDVALKHAQKLMTLYTQQLAALNKHRGKGQQKVTVEHVNVQAGGQAIVGHVEAGAAQQKTQEPASDTLEHTNVPRPASDAPKRRPMTRRS